VAEGAALGKAQCVLIVAQLGHGLESVSTITGHGVRGVTCFPSGMMRAGGLSHPLSPLSRFRARVFTML